MKFHQLDGFAFILVLISIATAVILILNVENIKILSFNDVVIKSQSDYQLESFDQSSIIEIELTPSSVFNLQQEIDNKLYNLYSTNEYVFDFIIISEIYPNVRTSFTCRDVTNLQSDLLYKTRSEFDNPADLGTVLEEQGIVISNESRESLMQNTTGQFGDATRLLDCTKDVSKTNAEIYLLIFLEIIIVSSALIFIYRDRIKQLLED